MALSSSPRKTIPLASGDEPRRDMNQHPPSVTKRVFYCGVVVEGSEHGRRLPDEIQDLVLSLGNPLPSEDDNEMLSSSSSPSHPESGQPQQRRRALTDTSALSSVINELVTSERSYVRRLQILKNDYADPLRNFARSKDTAIIPLYEAKTLFGNVDNLIPVNEAFLLDLEKMLAPNGATTVGGIGDVALRHFKELQGFEQYKQYYVKREEAQRIFEREVSKRSSRFASYIDHIKYQSTDSKNRIGLRELLMEPVQRIPRYTLLFRTILKHMAPDDPQRPKLVEADEIASKIAQAETDEQTKRAAIFYCLSTTIDGFPPDLFSNSRKYIDCIDVEDVIGDAPMSSAASSTSGISTSLHCTLFLFDDKLLIVKRPNGDKGGRALSGLDALDKVTKSGGLPMAKKKSGMSCKGVVDVIDVVASDPGGPDIHLYLENPPQDQSERWAGRPFRSLAVVLPPSPLNLDPMQTESAKRRFLENLWQVQAMYRAKQGQSVILCSDEQEVESRTSRLTYARTYFNVYTRTAFLQEPKKTKVVVHVDPLGSADPIPLGMEGPPFLRIRVQPIAGGLCRFAVNSSDPADEGEEDIVQSERVPSRIITTIHQFGLFSFRTGRNASVPGTPTARSKASIFGLDAISRGLFHGRPASAMGDFFGGSINGHRRSKSSTASRSSMYTSTTGTDSFLRSHRSNSTAATSLDDESSFFSSRSSKGKSKRGLGGSTSDSDGGSLGKSFLGRSLRSRSLSRSQSQDRGSDYSDLEDDDGTIMAKPTDSSDYNLALQLELARQNSLNQHGKPLPPIDLDIPIEDTIYEGTSTPIDSQTLSLPLFAEEPPQSVRPASRASGDTRRSTTPRPASPTKRSDSPALSDRDGSRPVSRLSDRRPFGPRSVSPMPSSMKSPSAASPAELPGADKGYVSESDDEVFKMDITKTPFQRPSGIPRSRRQPLQPSTENIDATPKPLSNPSSLVTSSVEPLSIKKKTSVRGTSSSLPLSPTPARKIYAKGSPLNRPVRTSSPRKVSPSLQVKRSRAPGSHLPIKCELVEDLVRVAVGTKNDIEFSHRAVKRMKVELDKFNANGSPSEDPFSRPASPDKSLRMPVRSQPLTREAQQRMEEMQKLLSHRQGDGTPRTSRLRTGIFEQASTSAPPSNNQTEQMTQFAKTMSSLTSDADQGLTRALSNQESLERDLNNLANQFKEKLLELERARLELQNAKRQTELVKSLLADATAEKEIMYEAFNEELDGMYNDINLPDDEAFVALTKDLQTTKESRNELSQENSQLKRRLAEAELQRDEWAQLLRHHGLIP
ncbi:signal transducer [Coprinopsis cinerea AmutBmut pab1-1]|nr:signal transducer [Coprinopsis cinerea AmutBmut pab1-1]